MVHDVAVELGEGGAEELDEEGEIDPSSRSSSPDQIPLEIARLLEDSLQGAWAGACGFASASSKGRTGVAFPGRRKLGSSPQSALSLGVASIARSGRAGVVRELDGSIAIRQVA